jgi:hypothetical protein
VGQADLTEFIKLIANKIVAIKRQSVPAILDSEGRSKKGKRCEGEGGGGQHQSNVSQKSDSGRPNFCTRFWRD